MAKKKNAAKPADQAAAAASVDGSLSICRNKHWRYISAYHGNWLSLPIELLECIAIQNWNQPSPRAVEPGVLFDVLKIRRLVELAAEDAVRAANGIVQTAMKGSSRDYTSLVGDGGGQLSKQRIFKIRQKACRSLAEAFAIDEIAASVASMAATSTLEDVAHHVLRHDPRDLSATYVHFFHEKIPSRAMKQHTSLKPLDDMMASLPWEAHLPPLRTRAGVRSYKGEYVEAIADYNNTLRIMQHIDTIHGGKPNTGELELASKLREESSQSTRTANSAKKLPPIKDEDRPTGLALQLLFSRASAYLSCALEGVDQALDGLQDVQESQGDKPQETLQQRHLDARKHVKTNAKRALKDLLAFLNKIEYTPGLPDSLPMYAATLTSSALTEDETSGRTAAPSPPPIIIYTASMLFSEKPPSDLPPLSSHNSNSVVGVGERNIQEPIVGKECVTFHPLLIEALHLLLIAHALVQTSVTELRRHALGVIRLSGLASGSSVFQLARSPARSDWSEILRNTNDWLGLGASWQDLMLSTRPNQSHAANAGQTARPKALLPDKSDVAAPAVAEVSSGQNGDAAHESMIEVLSDDRVVDEKSFHQAFLATQTRRELHDGPQTAAEPSSNSQSLSTGLSVVSGSEVRGESKSSDNAQSRSATPGKGERQLDPVSTQRAQAVSRWIKEAPLSLGGAAKKRRTAHKKTKKQPVGSGASALADSVTSLSLSTCDDEVDSKLNDE